MGFIWFWFLGDDIGLIFWKYILIYFSTERYTSALNHFEVYTTLITTSIQDLNLPLVPMKHPTAVLWWIETGRHKHTLQRFAKMSLQHHKLSLLAKKTCQLQCLAFTIPANGTSYHHKSSEDDDFQIGTEWITFTFLTFQGLHTSSWPAEERNTETWQKMLRRPLL